MIRSQKEAHPNTILKIKISSLEIEIEHLRFQACNSRFVTTAKITSKIKYIDSKGKNTVITYSNSK